MGTAVDHAGRDDFAPAPGNRASKIIRRERNAKKMATQFGSLSDEEYNALVLPLHATNTSGDEPDGHVPMSAVEKMQQSDPSDEDTMVMRGLVQGILDIASNQRPHDKWTRETISSWNPGYALGYEMGVRHASDIIIAMRNRKKFRPVSKFDSTSLYGSAGMRRASR